MPEPTPALADVIPREPPVAVATPTPLPGAVTTRVTDGTSDADQGGWLLWGGIALVVVAALIAAGVILPRRRRDRTVEEAPEPTVTPVATPPAPVPAAPIAEAASVARVVPTIGYRPTRVGLNLLSMTVDGEALLANATDAPVEAIRVRAAVLAAVAGHEAAVVAFHRDPSGRLAAPPFALAPGESRAVRVIVASPRDRIDALTVAGRPMVVPLVAVTVDWRDAAGEHRRTQAFAVGIERVDSAKLSPVWLDQDARMFDAVAARPHGDPID